MNFDDLTPEQKEKAIACETPEELFALAKDAGRELTDDEVEAISAGVCWTNCPQEGECPHHK